MNYKVNLTTKVNTSSLKEGRGIIVLEPEDYTSTKIKNVKKKGYTVLAYLSVGTLEKNRSWYDKFEKDKLKQLDDWPDEYYMDICNKTWTNHIIELAKQYKGMGFDGWWLDNIDVYSEYKSKKMFEAIKSLLSKLRSMNVYIMINGGSEWIDDAIDKGMNLTKYLNGYTQEEVFSLIKDYSKKGKFDKQKDSDSKYYRTLMKKAMKIGVACFCLEYTKDENLKTTIKKWCKNNGASYYISGDVNL